MGNKSCGLCSCECYSAEIIIQNSDSKLFPYVEKVSSIFPFFASLCLEQTVLQLSRKLLCFTEFLSLSIVSWKHMQNCSLTEHTMSADESDSLPRELYKSSSCCCGWRCFHMREWKKSFFETFMFMAFAIIIKSIASNMHVEGDRQQPWVWVGEFNMEMFTERDMSKWKLKEFFFSSQTSHTHHSLISSTLCKHIHSDYTRLSLNFKDKVISWRASHKTVSSSFSLPTMLVCQSK